MPNLPSRPTPEDLQKAYEEGLEGWIWDKEVEEDWNRFWDGSPSLYAEFPGLLDNHKKTKRALLYRYRENFDPGAYGQEAQTTGDCTSHGDRNARDTSRAVEVAMGEPEIYYKRGATEPTYGARGHAGQGMDPARAARFVTEWGWLFREAYKDVNTGVNLDLSKYNANIGHNWGRSGVPQNVRDLCRQFNVGKSVRPRTIEEAMDCISAGWGGHSGQQWGTASRQPSDGINRRTTGWNHDMGTVGMDLTEEYFKEQVFFVANSWGSWNQPNPIWLANQDVYGPWVPGMIVVPIGEYDRYYVKSGSIHFYTQIKSKAIRELPSLDDGVL